MPVRALALSRGIVSSPRVRANVYAIRALGHDVIGNICGAAQGLVSSTFCSKREWCAPIWDIAFPFRIVVMAGPRLT